MNYYSMPLKLNEVMKGKHLAKTDVRLAIHQNIRLMLKTWLLRYRFDPTFGSKMLKYQSQTPPQKKNERLWRESMREEINWNIKDLLERYETRVKVTDVFADFSNPGKTSTEPTVKVRVEIHGQLTFGRKEKFHYPDNEIEDDAQDVFPLLIPLGKY